MKAKEIIEIIEKIELMNSITKISIKSEGIEIDVEKTKQNTVRSVQPTQHIPNERENTNFETAALRKKAAPGMASAFQVKYARDLMMKIFGTDDRLALDFLAHTLGVPMKEVPEIEAWDDSLTVDMVSLIIDGLQPMYKGKGKGEF